VTGQLSVNRLFLRQPTLPRRTLLDRPPEPVPEVNIPQPTAVLDVDRERHRTAAEMLASSRTCRRIAAARGRDAMVPERWQEVVEERLTGRKESVSLRHRRSEVTWENGS
jgi:hypothetical protein